MPPEIPPEEMEVYKRTARRRWQVQKERLEVRRAHAWQLARQAARLLKEEFSVGRVVVFGSLAQDYLFNEWSDVDLAAWGLNAKNWLRAISAARKLSDEIEINLVDVTSCSPELLATIEREGLEL